MENLFVDIARKKYDNVTMVCLSMGMSDDFEDAIGRREHHGAGRYRYFWPTKL